MVQQPIRILLVDDNAADRDLIVSLMRQISGYRVEIEAAATFERGQQALAEQDFDACLVDYRLDGRSGLELIEQNVRQGRRCPFLLLTGLDSHDVDVEAARAGAAGFLSKSDLSAESIERAIRYAVEGLRYRAEQHRRGTLKVLRRLWDSPPVALDRDQSSGTLQQSHADAFENLVDCYAELLDLALEQRAYKVEHDISEGLEAMAEQLGALLATPRDVVEIHYAATRRRTEGAANERALSCIEEGQLMALELMGYLADYYRRFARSNGRARPRQSHVTHEAVEGSSRP
jgi:DNA-binding NarL/FixJ family response regulator